MCPPPNSYVEFLAPDTPPNVTVFEGKFFKEVIKVE